MPSEVWGRDPQEAFEEPYEYAVQDQFVREATRLFQFLYQLLNSDKYQFTILERSRKKAIWMLSMDALDSQRDSLDALKCKKHRVAAKLFRDIIESLDLAALFDSGIAKRRGLVEKWYSNGIIPHREYRNYIEKSEGKKRAEELRVHYCSLSNFTHRSYRAILDGYSKGRGERLVHDGTAGLHGKSEESLTLLVLPQVISTHYAVLANLTTIYADQIQKRRLVKREEIAKAFADSLESETIPRRFLPRRWLVEKLLHSKIK
jgi:hypothetical protein